MTASQTPSADDATSAAGTERLAPSASESIGRVLHRLSQIEDIMHDFAGAGPEKRAKLIRSAQRHAIEIARRLLDLTGAQ